MRIFITIVMTLAVACGSDDHDEQTSKQFSDISEPQPSEQSEFRSNALALQDRNELPACDDSRSRMLVYVINEERFVVCDAGNWSDIEIKGKDGVKGESGDDKDLSVFDGETLLGRFAGIGSNGETLIFRNDLIVGVLADELFSPNNACAYESLDCSGRCYVREFGNPNRAAIGFNNEIFRPSLETTAINARSQYVPNDGSCTLLNGIGTRNLYDAGDEPIETLLINNVVNVRPNR